MPIPYRFWSVASPGVIDDPLATPAIATTAASRDIRASAAGGSAAPLSRFVTAHGPDHPPERSRRVATLTYA